ncbi:MAG: hypothetical protein ACM32O_12200 [Clostridia bacterium]
MRTRLHAWTLVMILLACLLTAGCSEGAKIPVSDPDSNANLTSQFGTIEKVSVMTTDGQELYLNKEEFVQHAVKEAALLPSQVDIHTKQDDARFTLIVYRSQAAPFVMEIGPGGSEDSDRFYRWIRKEAAKVLFKQMAVRTVEVEADDLQKRYLPTEEETIMIAQQLAAAEFRESNLPQYSLYPGYRLNVNMGERTMGTRLLSPSLLCVSLGKEELYYNVSTDLFSKVTSWLPPQMRNDSNPFAPLFKATKVTLSPSGKEAGNTLAFDPNESSLLQGLLHETVRTFQKATPSVQHIRDETAADYYLRLQVGTTEYTIRIYGDSFRYLGKMYYQPQLKSLIASYRQALSKE